ncbi:MAG TPA: DUF4377 domain-containing protein [Gemmatimonadaceae bacterium]|nr:DUF4377 domain-containing protein [Gemmatimonadaceae bacterium]
MPHITTRRLLRLAALTLVLGGACRSSTEPAERVLTLHVAAALAPCTAVAPRECMQVRERPDLPWELFYDTIDGFTYEPGYQYQLRVARRTVPNPPQDVTGLAWRLLAVVEKTPRP